MSRHESAIIRTVVREYRRAVQNIRPEAVMSLFLSRAFANFDQDYAPYSRSLILLDTVLTR
jgi:hypothetical protein